MKANYSDVGWQGVWAALQGLEDDPDAAWDILSQVLYDYAQLSASPIIRELTRVKPITFQVIGIGTCLLS
jgi:hypothetical protein